MFKKQTTTNQWETLLDHMNKHPNLARGVPIFGSNKKEMDESWEELTTKLNALGPPQRESKDWKKVWSDLRVRTKKKICEKKLQIIATGGGAYTQIELSPIEKACDSIVFASKATHPTGEVFGLKVQMEEETSNKRTAPQKESMELPTTSTSSLTTPKGNAQSNKNQCNEVLLENEQLKRKIICEAGPKKVQKVFEYESLQILKEQFVLQKESLQEVRQMKSAANRIADALEKLANWTEK